MHRFSNFLFLNDVDPIFFLLLFLLDNCFTFLDYFHCTKLVSLFIWFYFSSQNRFDHRQNCIHIRENKLRSKILVNRDLIIIRHLMIKSVL